MDPNKLNRHLRDELMSLAVFCPNGCKEEILYVNLDQHLDKCEGKEAVKKEDIEEESKHANKYQHLLFAMNRETTELIRYDIGRAARIKISVGFTQDPKSSFPQLFQFIFMRNLGRMFIIGGSNTMSENEEELEVAQGIGKDGPVFGGYLLSTARTGWEIHSDKWITVRKFKTSLPRYGHTSLEIDTNFIYSIGGKHNEASKWIERYEVDKASEKCVELNHPRFFSSCCSFNNKCIYIYGGYSSENNSLLNSIERLDHENCKI